MKRLLTAFFVMIGFTTAAAACPNFQSQGESYQATGDQLYQQRQFRVVAGGQNFIGNCPNVRPRTDRGRGFFTSTPDFTFYLSGMSRYQLVIQVASACDSALLINTATAGWYYDDDDAGNLDPRIVLTRPADGRLDVWIGTYDGNYCDAVLALETFLR